MKTPDRNDLKLGTVEVLDSVWQPSDFGFKRSGVRGTGSIDSVFRDCHLG